MPELMMPDVLGSYAKGKEIRYQQDERARKQPILEKLEKLNIAKTESTLKTLSQNQSLNDIKTRESALEDFSKGYKHIVENNQLAMNDPNMSPEAVSLNLENNLGELRQAIEGKYQGFDLEGALDGDPELIASLGALGQDRDIGSAGNLYLEQTKNLTPEERALADKMSLGLVPKKGTISKDERIVSDPELKEDIVSFEGDKAGSKETSKLKAQLEIAPMIAAAKAEAAVVGKDAGDDVVKLKFLEANMPNIEATVGKLKKLNETATYTAAGRFTDGVFRQLGWEVPEGATSRAQAISIVNSTILPLLRPTFGAQFTEREGNKLVEVWGDPNASEKEKAMALDGMLMAVRLETETVRRKLGKDKPKGQLIDLSTVPDEDLFK